MTLEPLMRLFDAWREERLVVLHSPGGIRCVSVDWHKAVVLLITQTFFMTLRHGLCY